MQLAASACKNWMRLAASRIQIAPAWPLVACNMIKIHGNLPATGRHAGTICMRLAATRLQFECDWRPLGYNLNATGRQSHAIFACDWRPLGYNLFATGLQTHIISLLSGSQSHTFTHT
jgi:hypothetical protein